MPKTPKARALGSALRTAREDQGIKLRELAIRIDRDPGVLSRWETGERTPKPEHVSQILTALGINGARYEEVLTLAYDPDASHWVAAPFAAVTTLAACERNAAHMAEVSPMLVPGLFQTTEYIRAIMTAGGVPDEEVATRIAIRIARQDVLTRTNPVPYRAFVGEAALHQRVGCRDVLIEQLRRLADLSRLPHIDFRVIPFSCGWNPSMEGGFSLVIAKNGSSVVQIEGRRSGLFLHDAEDVAAYSNAVDYLRRVCLSRNDSAKLVAGLVHRMVASV